MRQRIRGVVAWRAVAWAPWLFCGLLVAACGGGSDVSGGDTSGGPIADSGGSDVSGTRVARARFDFDNNGIDDGIMLSSYDAAGRLTTEAFTYSGDGTPDTEFGSFTIGAPSGALAGDQLLRYSYDADGRLTDWVVETPGSTFTARYTLGGDGRVLDVTMTFSTMPGITLKDVVNYSGDAIDSIDRMTDGVVRQRLLFTYDGLGRVATQTKRGEDGTVETVDTYLWNADGSIGTIETHLDDGTLFGVIRHEYDALGRLASEHNTTFGALAETYRFRHFYDVDPRMEVDMGDDGTVEAVVRVELEPGPCTRPLFWAAGASPNFAAPGSGPFRPGTGYVYLNECVGG